MSDAEEHERSPTLDEEFNRGVCERLTRSEQPYYNSHGQYIKPLAHLVNQKRNEIVELEGERDRLKEDLRISRDLVVYWKYGYQELEKIMEKRTKLSGIKPVPS